MYTNSTQEDLLQRIHEFEQELRECRDAKEELNRSRDYLAGITQGMYEGFVVIDREYRIKEVNDRYLNYHGRTRKEVIGATCYEISHMVDELCPDQARVCPAKAVFDSGAPLRITHDRAGCQNQRLTFEIYAFPLFGQDGTVEHVVRVPTRLRIANGLKTKKCGEKRLRLSLKWQARFGMNSINPCRRLCTASRCS